MNNRKKNAIYSLILVILLIAVWLYRNQEDNEKVDDLYLIEFSGATMGDIQYMVKYLHKNENVYKQEVDSVLRDFNASLSTYIEDSEISQFNRESSFTFELPYFLPVVQRSKEIFEHTEGAFDPTIAPLVNAWGFGPGKSRNPSNAIVDSLLQLVDYNYIDFDSTEIRKTKDHVQLDFSAIAKGYGVDAVADFLRAKGMERFYVEIGGEIVAEGKNARNQFWTVGISKPEEEEPSEDAFMIFTLNNKALATSGNYRNFYEADGQKFAHTISPFTGRPVQHSLLSASVFAADCMTADAYATAFMVIGLEKSIEIIESSTELDALLIYSDEAGRLDTYISKGVQENIVN